MGKGTTQLGKYIWIPKPKTDLKEFRDTLKLANILEEREGYFNDRTLGMLQVEKGAIFDGSLSTEEYFDKYRKKAVADQSYVSNARMTLRLLRWFGWVTRTTEKGKFKLTPRGKEYLVFRGKWPDFFSDKDEYKMMLFDILTFKYYSGNDLPQNQDREVKKRPMLAILVALDELGKLHNHEIAICSLTDASEFDKKKIIEPVIRMRKGKTTIQDEYRLLNWNPEEKSHVTDVYDGPKVLCSILRQLNVVGTDIPNDEEKKYYERVYSGRLMNSVPRNLFKITEGGHEILPHALKPKPIWWEDLEPATLNLTQWVGNQNELKTR